MVSDFEDEFININKFPNKNPNWYRSIRIISNGNQIEIN